ncbi:MAG TPA: 1-phosphofructokinase [Candidatus Angelobacter sp.]|nr:1-phosphofructokinase [Candidatus Angelobacter sp.]
MIVTVTLNPSLDQTLEVDSLVRGGINKTEHPRRDPGGKGVNVARALSVNGVPAVAVLPAGGLIGDALVSLLVGQGVAAEVVRIAGMTRANVTVIEADGTTTKLNEPGPTLSTSELDAVLAAVAGRVGTAGWIVAGGSLPPGLGPEVYARLAETAAEHGARLAVDTSGSALRESLAYRPDLVKPNADELAEAVGHELRTLGDVVKACGELQSLGAGAVLCSLGRDGAVLVEPGGAWHARGPQVAVVNTVGAGDALLAGALYAGGSGPDALRTGVAWATAAVATTGTGVPVRDAVHLDAVAVTADLDPAQPLTEEK